MTEPAGWDGYPFIEWSDFDIAERERHAADKARKVGGLRLTVLTNDEVDKILLESQGPMDAVARLNKAIEDVLKAQMAEATKQPVPGTKALGKYLMADPNETIAIEQMLQRGAKPSVIDLREPLPMYTCINRDGGGVVPGNIVQGITATPPSEHTKKDHYGEPKTFWTAGVFWK